MSDSSTLALKHNSSWRAKVQKFGGVLSAMVMPNIGAFIAWGLLTALFIPTGWYPSEYLGALVGPTVKYMLPLLIGYTAGMNIYGGRRGGVIGAVATMGVVIGAEQVMLVGGMFMGAFGAWCMKKIDNAFKGRVKPGLEMLVDNFSLGIFGALIMIAGFVVIEPAFAVVQGIITSGVAWITDHGLIPLAGLFVAPAQVLFLNNAINHGIMVPLGIEQVHQLGKSIFFLVESNGGTWLGLVLAFCLYGKGAAKRSAPAAAGILFLGGIGEVVFPFALIKPITLLGPILANIAALTFLQAFNGGTVGAVSPGSFIAMVVMTPKGAFFVNIAAYALATVISFVVVAFFLKRDRSAELSEAEELAAEQGTLDIAGTSDGMRSINRVTIVCDAGMGSSVMGLSILRNKCRKAMLNLELNNVSVDHVPQNADVIITNKVLEERVRSKLTNDPIVLTIENYLDNKEYDRIIETIKEYKS
ncbi:PTS mannitol transporter subunit IICB [Escherichia coli]|nr:PTS mannitol transporter subunit IICB [Escherichia coli]